MVFFFVHNDNVIQDVYKAVTLGKVENKILLFFLNPPEQNVTYSIITYNKYATLEFDLDMLSPCVTVNGLISM